MSPEVARKQYPLEVLTEHYHFQCKVEPVGMLMTYLDSPDRCNILFKDIKVSEVMTTNLIICESEDDLCYVTTIMIKNRIRHLPIVENTKIVAMLSIRDVVKAQVSDLRAENHYLKDYISDKYPG